MTSGTIPRRELRQRRPAGRPPNYVPLLGVLVLGVMVLLWVAGRFSLDSGAAVAVASPTSSATLAAGSARPTQRPTPTVTPTVTPSPTATPSPTPTPTPTPSPSPSPTPSPTPTASPSPSPSPIPAPTAPPVGLIILAPADGAIVGQRQLVISGLARPGSPITWDRPLWFDDHTTADGLGNWSFSVALAEGENAFTFRIGDDFSTAQTIIVRYQP